MYLVFGVFEKVFNENFMFSVPYVVVQLCDVNKKRALFKINVLIQFLSSTCFKHLMLITLYNVFEIFTTFSSLQCLLHACSSHFPPPEGHNNTGSRKKPVGSNLCVPATHNKSCT
jgi:hypothetical protein